MKRFVLLFFIIFGQVASAVSINPEKTVTPLLHIFSPKNKQINETQVSVQVSSYDKTGEIKQGKETLEMSLDAYNKAQTLSSAVYVSSPLVPNSEDGEFHMGTAFHIGENLVLTNHHVLSPDRTNFTECADFQLKDNGTKALFPCKKVHHCSAELDVCLIELGESKLCLNALCTKSKIIQLSDKTALKLKAKPQMELEKIDSAIMTCIGNTMNLGIHFGQGRGYRINRGQIYFFAPLRPGNSGGPLLGDDDLVWGVVKQEFSGEVVGPGAFNVAASMDTVIQEMRENLTGSILEKFNKAIQE